METVPITKSGYEKLREELDRLTSVERPENIKAIEVARGHGDLSENAEYHAAKERQGLLEGRIGELAYRLAAAEVIDPDTSPKQRAVFASTVVLENIDTGEEVEYQLVGPYEANIEEGSISVTSPLGKAIIGKEPGEEIVLQVPAGKRTYELLEIR